MKMSQSVFTLAGSIAGMIVALLFVPPVTWKSVFVGATLAAWLATGAYGFIRGELTLSGRSSNSTKTYLGSTARILGFAIASLFSVITVVVISKHGP
jgi:hypothetical protein